MKLSDFLPSSPEEFHRLSHCDTMTKVEIEEIQKFTMEYFYPIFARCIKECGPITNSPGLELRVQLMTVSLIDHVVRNASKETVQ